MNTSAVNEHLAHLLQVQGGLLDAYLEQNLGKRYAYAITVWEVDAPRRVRAVTNVTHQHDVRMLVRGLGHQPQVKGAHPIEVERAPMLIEPKPSPGEGS